MRHFLTTLVLAASITLSTFLPDARFIHDPIQWHGLSNGVNITLYGTASLIATQLKKLDPDWTPLPHNIATRPESNNLQKRNQTSLLCCPVIGQNWTGNPTFTIGAAAIKVREIGGFTNVPPKTCQMVECYCGAGIYACNDSANTTWQIMYNSLISDYANIISGCPYYNGWWKQDVCGQQFDDGGWNVIAHSCPGHC